MDRLSARYPACIRLAPALLIAMLVVHWAGAASACDVDRPREARQFVERLSSKAREIMKQNASPLIPLTAHILAGVEFDPLAKYALGRFWRIASLEQRAEYKTLFRETVSHALARQVLRFRNAELKISKQPVFGANGVLLKSKLVLTDTQVTRLDWRIGFHDCRAYIADIVRDGVSLITVKRDEFRTVVSRKGIRGLLAGLRRIANRQARETVGSHVQSPRAILNRLILEAAADLAPRIR